VQHVKMSYSITECTEDGKEVNPNADSWAAPVLSTTRDGNRRFAFEDDYLTGNQDEKPNPQDPDHPLQRRTKGCFKIEGHARFIQGYELKSPMPWIAGGSPGHNDCAGILKTMNSGPTDLPDPPLREKWPLGPTKAPYVTSGRQMGLLLPPTRVSTVYSVPPNSTVLPDCPPMPAK